MSIFSLKPVFQERIWGGQNLKTLFNREIPQDELIGESWELTDRPEAQTLVIEKGKTLHELWQSPERKTIFGTKAPAVTNFPILIKLLDAQDKLSLQVHPPAALAAKFNGEPKTEMWYFLATTPTSKIYVGLKKGVTRETFKQAIAEKNVADCFHVIETSAGEAMFLPSGRVHAIGAGNVILEIQQNSDTTFRVYDWDRIDAKSGKSRDLHIAESLECINFKDYEPTLVQPHANKVVGCDYFAVYKTSFDEIGQSEDYHADGSSFYYLFIARGKFNLNGQEYGPGTSLLVTADHGRFSAESLENSGEIISVVWPN